MIHLEKIRFFFWFSFLYVKKEATKEHTNGEERKSLLGIISNGNNNHKIRKK